MSQHGSDTATTGRPGEPQAQPTRRFRLTTPYVLLGLAVLIVLFSIVSAITGANDLTSGGTIGAAIALAVPLAMTGLGGLWAERAGVVNIGLEGQMLLGTWGALYAYTPELYPTASRATGMGAAGAMARLGGLVAPSVMTFVVTLGLGVAIGLFAGLLVIAALAALAIDAETRQASLA